MASRTDTLCTRLSTRGEEQCDWIITPLKLYQCLVPAAFGHYAAFTSFDLALSAACAHCASLCFLFPFARYKGRGESSLSPLHYNVQRRVRSSSCFWEVPTVLDRIGPAWVAICTFKTSSFRLSSEQETRPAQHPAEPCCTI